jgi:hypothetical protein
MPRETKIVATLGPASNTPEIWRMIALASSMPDEFLARQRGQTISAT